MNWETAQHNVTCSGWWTFLFQASGGLFHLLVFCRNVGQVSHSMVSLSTQQWWVLDGMKMRIVIILSGWKSAAFSSRWDKICKREQLATTREATVCVCVRVCVRACARACVCVPGGGGGGGGKLGTLKYWNSTFTFAIRLFLFPFSRWLGPTVPWLQHWSKNGDGI